MSIDFLKNYGGQRLAQYSPQPSLWDELPDDSDEEEWEINLDYETNRSEWQPIDTTAVVAWRAGEWPEAPVRFVDGKDVGQTIAWLRAPAGYPVPVRLSQIGGTTVRVRDGECRREFALAERVVSMVADVFPWNEVERFAADLQANGFRLLPAQPRGGTPSYDFEEMRRATEDRSNGEMRLLEAAAVAQDSYTPTIVDGRLESRRGGFDSVASPVFGVIKKQYRNYLDPRGMQLLYELEAGQRTPVFSLPNEKLPVISWYIRLVNENGAMPNWGLVRVEALLGWFETRGRDFEFVNRLSRIIYEYRSRERSYRRAPVSLHPIVRAEEILGAQFSPTGTLANRFYRLTGL